jgi:hypothetical protein
MNKLKQLGLTRAQYTKGKEIVFLGDRNFEHLENIGAVTKTKNQTPTKAEMKQIEDSLY